MKTRLLMAGALSSLTWLGCAALDTNDEELDESDVIAIDQQEVVYGTDNRQDVYAHPNATLRARAQQATVALMRPAMLDTSNPNNVTFNATTLGSWANLCTTERFRSDPVAADCSGTLIDDDLVLTAGHCITNESDPNIASCGDTRFVFNYYRPSAGTLQMVTTADIFSCQSVVSRNLGVVNGQILDYAIVRLDRPATPRFTPAPVRKGNTALATGSNVAVIGSGSGIPFKIDSGGAVRDARAGVLDYFVANTDTFSGNSGSAVYEANSYSVAGILVRGENDYVPNGSCDVVNTCTETACRGEDVTYVYPAIEDYCASSSSTRLCNGRTWLTAEDGKALSGDFNGDGRSDWMKWRGSAQGWVVCLSNGTNAFASCSTWLGMGDGNAVTGDFNKDGRSDWMRWDGSPYGWTVCLSNGTAFTNCSTWLGMGDGKALAGDFNGDGRSDWMRWDNSPVGWTVCLSDGTKFTNCGNWLPGMGDGNALTADFNGDGRSDWMRWDNSPLGWHVCLSNGTNGFTSCTNWLPGVGDGHVLAGDFSGDGRADWAGWDAGAAGWKVCLSNGTNAFNNCTTWLPGVPDGNALAGDFNKDKRTDLSVFEPANAWKVWLR